MAVQEIATPEGLSMMMEINRCERRASLKVAGLDRSQLACRLAKSLLTQGEGARNFTFGW